MGMYTEIFVNVDLIAGVPASVVDTLRAMCNFDLESTKLNGNHERWGRLFSNSSFYTPRTSCANLTRCQHSGEYSLLAKGDIKNYENEIEHFFEFIKPWCKDHFLGYMRYEEDYLPTIITKTEEIDLNSK